MDHKNLTATIESPDGKVIGWEIYDAKGELSKRLRLPEEAQFRVRQFKDVDRDTLDAALGFDPNFVKVPASIGKIGGKPPAELLAIKLDPLEPPDEPIFELKPIKPVEKP